MWLWIFQNTENCPVQTLTLCNYEYSRTLKTVSAKHWYCGIMDITEHWKLFQCKTLTLCNYRYSRTLKTVPVQNIDTVQLQIFQKIVQNIDELCTYRYSVTLNTVCSIDIHEHWWLMSFQGTYELCSYRHVYRHYGVLRSWILISARLLEYPCSLDMFMNIMSTVINEWLILCIQSYYI